MESYAAAFTSPSEPHPASLRARAQPGLDAATIRWLKQLKDEGVAQPQTLFDRFPHVLAKIGAAWGSRQAMDELMSSDLLFDNRGGRQGFPFEALAEIQALYAAHRERFPALAGMGQPWDDMP